MCVEKVGTLVTAWFAGEHTMFDACTEEPELAWLAILKILDRKLSERENALLAAGPLETLLGYHGEKFIDRVEREASTNPLFRDVLCGVWQKDMPDDIWDRVIMAMAEAKN